jgi:Glycosyltransferase sugar-binding region containing DXD motif
MVSRSRKIAMGWGRISVLGLITAMAILVVKLQQLMFGPGPTHRGGRIGRWIDNAIRKMAFDQAVIRHDLEFEKCMGYSLPPIVEKGANQVGVHVILNSWLAQVLMRKKGRRDLIQMHESVSNGFVYQERRCVPQHIIQPNMGDWFRPIEFQYPSYVNTPEIANYTVLVFDNEQINDFLLHSFEKLYTKIYPRLDVTDQMQLFGIAATSVFGGTFVSSEIRNYISLNATAPGILYWIDGYRKNCDEKPAMWLQVDKTMTRIGVLSASQNHPKLKCSLEEFALSENDNSDLNPLISMIYERNWDPTCTNACCPLRDNHISSDFDATLIIGNASKVSKSDSLKDVPRFSIQISERKRNEPSLKEKKNRCSDRLRNNGCSAGWLCHRCLKTSYAGTFDACNKYCRSCYQDIVCTEPLRKTATIDVIVTESRDSQEKRIPRIIHQTYFEALAPSRYPHLQRLQNSWKASGWDYRFYSDADCHEYIQMNYPDRFSEAYSSILPGAFKADFFRLLVLFKEGGIYADIDVQLETDLDRFITTNLSLVVPRDVPLDYWPSSNYCLWNGLLGSAPGHPIIAKALEDIVTTIENRHDYYDVEGRLCSKHPVAVWKLRTLPILILTGPCALGMSMNAALGNSDVLAGFELGLLNTNNLSLASRYPVDYFWGDVMTLLTDRYDIGELRFTDIDRNLLVASTNHDRFAKAPIEYTTARSSKESVHYSKSDTDIVGEYRVYKDDMVTNENVKLFIQHRYA